MDDLQTAILGYTPDAKTKHLLGNTLVLLIVGPTASGKNTLERELLKTGEFRPIVTHTSRKPRSNHGVLEQDGEEYHFISNKQAMQMLKEHKFVEAAFTHGHLYGTSIEEFSIAKKEGKTAVADIDIKGVRSYRQLSDKVIAIFLLPPSFKVLLQRLLDRYGSSNRKEDIKIRLATALDELSELLNTDYYYPMISGDIKEVSKKAIDIVNGTVSLKPEPQTLKVAQKLIYDIKDYLAKQ